MERVIRLFLILAIIFGTAISFGRQAAATSSILPGDTDEECVENYMILSSINEAEVFAGLSNTAASVRSTAAQRLGEIGTNYSLSRLEDFAGTDADSAVRQEAALSFWKIKYRLSSASTSAEYLLLSIFDVPQDATKTLEAKVYAMQELADMGSRQALTKINSFAVNTRAPQSADFIRQHAEECVSIIKFINDLPADMSLDDKIKWGLSDPQLPVRKWAVRALAKEKPENLKEQLEAELYNAQANKDNELANYIAGYLEEVKNTPVSLVFSYPTGDITVSEQRITITGYAFGESFSDSLELHYGDNTYTKTVTGPDGQVYTETLHITLNNHPPVLAAIPQRQAEVGTAITFTLSATDEDNEELSYYCFNPPQGAAFNPATRVFTWTPQERGAYNINFTVFDPNNLYDQKTAVIQVAKLNAPTNLTAQAASASSITLTWQDNSNSEGGYKLYRKASNNPKLGWILVATRPYPLAANTTTYTDTGLSPNTTYTYMAYARGRPSYGFTEIRSAYSNEASATPTTPPAAPSGLTTTIDSPTQVTLTWTDNSNNETAFAILRAPFIQGQTPIYSEIYNTRAPSITTYTDNSGLALNGRYLYKIQALNGAMPSSFTTPASAWMIAPSAPTLLTAVVDSNIATQVNLGWQDNASNENGFILERKIGLGNWQELNTIPKPLVRNTRAYSDTGLTRGNAYSYRVKAVNGIGASVYSNEPAVSVPLPGPTLRLRSIVNGGFPGYVNVILEWDYDDYPGIAKFVLEYASQSPGDDVFTTYGPEDISLVYRSHTYTYMPRTWRYRFRIKAVDAQGRETAYSDVLEVAVP